ncbi:MAG: TolB family protein [Candidatus Ratteibacteria bacterium]
MKHKLFLIFLFLSPFLSNSWHTEEEEGVLVMQPCFSPDGRKIIFTCDVAYENVDIWEIKVDGTGLKRLTKNIEGGVIRNPQFSPDGSKIVYELEGIVMRMNIDGTAQEKLDKWPSWYSTVERYSPDGKKSVFISRPPNASFPVFNIYIKNKDGTGRKQITFGDHQDSEPNWYPFGNKIIFHSNRDNTNGIWEVNIDGTGLRCLNPYGDYPVYSPDGTKIAFTRLNSLWIMNSDGTGERQLIKFENFVKPIVPVKFDPDKWNIEWLEDKKGEGYINCYIGGIEGDRSIDVEGYSVEQIDIGSIKLTVKDPVGFTYTLSPEKQVQILNSHSGFKEKVLKVKFNKFKAIETLKNNISFIEVDKSYKICIIGNMKDGQNFIGETDIKIIGEKK